jgi:chorismate mutase
MQNSKLTMLRQQIDEIDDEIIPLLEKRYSIICLIKKEKDKKITDKKREAFIIKKCHSNYSKSIYKSIFEVSKKVFLLPS